VWDAGCVYTWSIKTGGRLHQQDYINNSMSYNDLVTLPNGNIIVVGIQQATLGFDLEGLLNPSLENAKDTYRLPVPSGAVPNSRPGTASSGPGGSRDRELVYLSPAEPVPESNASHKFVVCWNNRVELNRAAGAAVDGMNEDLLGATQYIHYPDSTITVAPTKGTEERCSINDTFQTSTRFGFDSSICFRVQSND
jgi:hypothetical protein